MNHMDELAELLTEEQGKTIAYTRGVVFRGLQVVKHASGMGRDLLKGEIGNEINLILTATAYNLRKLLA